MPATSVPANPRRRPHNASANHDVAVAMIAGCAPGDGVDGVMGLRFRWCRFAPPLATGGHPFGMEWGMRPGTAALPAMGCGRGRACDGRWGAAGDGRVMGDGARGFRQRRDGAATVIGCGRGRACDGRWCEGASDSAGTALPP